MKNAICALLLSVSCLPVFAELMVIRPGNDVFRVIDDNGELISFGTIAFKPNWGWMGISQPRMEKMKNGAVFNYVQEKGALQWRIPVTLSGQELKISPKVTATRDFPLTYLGYGFSPGEGLNGGKVLVRDSAGTTKEVKIPINPVQATGVINLTFVDKNGKEHCRIDIAKPAEVHMHGNARILLAKSKMDKGQSVDNIFTVKLPSAAKFYSSMNDVPNQSDHSGWFAFQPTNNSVPGAIGMQDWLKIPEHQLAMKEDKVYADGRPFKIWGTNVEYATCKPSHEIAEKRAAFFAKYGITGVRQHKLTNDGWEGLGSKESASKYDPESMERFDYFNAQLRKNGIMYGFSPIWDLKIYEGDRKKLKAYDEIVKADPGKPTTKGLVWFAEDVQDLHIETLVNLLNHKNQYTGLRYAEDPALAYVEIQNEEDVFFYTTTPWMKKCPTYHKLFAKKFSAWLKKKYGSHEALVQAWGAGAINTFRNEGGLPDEHLDKENITPVGNPWFWDFQEKDAIRGKRLQDTARFLLESQNEYYQRAVDAVRKTGFKGPVVCSNWQAGSKTAHFLNLYSDAKFGIIDRHNYMGGAQGNPGHEMHTGHKLANHTCLNDPGSGLLSVGMQQVGNRPFMYSEWLSIPPAEWAAADTAIIAIYGFGLQDWDMSYHFASNGDGFSPQLQHPGNKKFNNLTPLGVGLYPILSRMLLRGDIKPGAVIATRRITLEQAIMQDYDFENKTVQQHDLKSFTGTPHHNALAMGRVLIEFCQKPKSSDIENLKKYQNGKTITSTTGQLNWTAPGGDKSGYITVNSPGTQGIIGFCGNNSFNLQDMAITSKSPYAVILATAKSQKGTLTNDKQVLIAAVARAHNTDMNLGRGMILNAGKPPIILEPVKAELTFKRKSGKVQVLDHDGIPNGQVHQLKNGKFQLDTERDKCLWYLVEFD